MEEYTMIEAEKRSTRYEEKLAVDGPDFVIQPGIVTGFLARFTVPVPASAGVHPVGQGSVVDSPDRTYGPRDCRAHRTCGDLPDPPMAHGLSVSSARLRSMARRAKAARVTL